MTDDLVQRLRRTYRKEYAATGPMFADNSNRLCPFPILATEVLFNPDGAAAADRIEALQAEVTRLKDTLSVETEPSPYCPICGSCGEEGCCGSKRCMYPDTGIEALEAKNKRLREHLISALDTLKDAEVCDDNCGPCNEAYAALQEQSK